MLPLLRRGGGNQNGYGPLRRRAVCVYRMHGLRRTWRSGVDLAGVKGKAGSRGKGCQRLELERISAQLEDFFVFRHK